MLTVQQAFDLALQHHQAGRLAEAEALYQQILAVQPTHAEALDHLGLVAHQSGRNEIADACIRRAILINPNNAAAYFHLGNISEVIGSPDQAIAHYRRALELKPDFLEALNKLGIVLARRGCLGESIATLRRVLACRPDSSDACYNLGVALMESGQLDEATALYRRATELDSNFAEAHYNLGILLNERYQFEEAIAEYRRVLDIQPDHAEACNNLGAALKELGRLDEATVTYRRLLEMKPDSDKAKFNYSTLLLLRGEFEQGWPLYEARMKATQPVQRTFSQPAWDGGSVGGKRVLIHSEQGFGDSIQFIRYASLIAERGGELMIECQRSLLNLFRSVKGVSLVVSADDPLPPYDLHVPMLSLPFVFKTTLPTIPRQVPYLFSDQTRRETLRGWIRHESSSHLRVGIAWAGNSEKIALRKRHIALEKLLPILQVSGVDFFSLQIGPGAEQLRSFSGARLIVDLSEHIHDFADTAAFMAELDLIISVDTAVAHLAGALGRPVWTLLPFVPDWRWGLEREDSPWYPTMRLFRQPALGDWDSVIQRVAGELTLAVAEKRLRAC